MKFLPILLITSLLFSAKGPDQQRSPSLQKTALLQWKEFDGNSIQCRINSSGPYADYLQTNSSGLFWPKGTYKTAVYTSGLLIVGKHRPTGMLRTAVQQYSTEFQPGPIDSTFNTTTNPSTAASDRESVKNRIYKINKGDNSANPDYAEWPGDLGAPFIDHNKNGRWDKGIDEPKLYGDQTLWCVYNDANTFLHKDVGTTLPMGMEVQAMYYGYQSQSALNNTMFIRWTIINKSDSHYDSLLIGLFSDVDMGDANDDVDGYDTTHSMSYVYNGDNDDAGGNGYGSLPPAVGTVFLSGSPEIRPYAFPVWTKGTANGGDPPLGNVTFPTAAYNYLRGLTKLDGQPNIDPKTGLPSRFAFTGDPITNTGWTRLNTPSPPGDMRTLLSLGPLTIAPGDTQVVDAAFVIAQGSNNLESLKRLRESVSHIRRVYSDHFSFPTATYQQTAVNDSISVLISVNDDRATASTITVDILSDQTNAILTSVQLNDDGSNGDKIPFDHIFSRNVTLPLSSSAARINAQFVDANGNTTRWDQLITKMPLTRTTVTEPTIVSDDLNHDGAVNPGENIRIALKVKNWNPFDLHSIEVRTEELSNTSKIVIDTLPAARTAIRPYQSTDVYSYLSISIPASESGSTLRLPVIITDRLNNQWIDTVSFPIVPLRTTTAERAKVSGKGNLNFEIVIVDSAAIKDHVYSISGIDSSTTYTGFRLSDLTANSIILPAIRLKGSSFSDLNHQLPVTDGFKITLKDEGRSSSTILRRVPSYSLLWFKPDFIMTPGSFWTPPSSVHQGDVANILIKFATLSGFTDGNSNGIFESSEPYTFDHSNPERWQKAYLYNPSSSSYRGFIDIPFAIYDVSNYPPRRLTAVITRNLSSPFPYRWMFGGDYVYVFNKTYDQNGTQYDSTKGGINLLPLLKSGGALPYYFSFYANTISNPLADTGDLYVDHTPAFSSRDVYMFNPVKEKVPTLIVPSTMELFQNYPNPFNPSTTIRFNIAAPAQVTVSVFNALGQKVRTLLNEAYNPGTYETEWNGRNDSDLPVASGLYFYRFDSGGTRITKKMLLLK